MAEPKCPTCMTEGQKKSFHRRAMERIRQVTLGSISFIVVNADMSMVFLLNMCSLHQCHAPQHLEASSSVVYTDRLGETITYTYLPSLSIK